MNIKKIKGSEFALNWVYILIGVSLVLVGSYLVGSSRYTPALLTVLVIPTVFVVLRPFVGLLIFVFLIPLESAFLGLGDGAVTVTRLLGFIIFGAWGLRLFNSHSKLEIFQPVKWIILFFFLALFSYFWAWNKGVVIARLQTILQFLGLVLVITNEVNNFQKLRSIIGVLFWGSILAGLLGLLGIGVDSRDWLLTLEGQSAKEYATYIGIVFLIATILMLYGTSKYKLIFGFLSLITLIPLFATGERGVILALVIAWLAILAISPQKSRLTPVVFVVLSMLYMAPIILRRLGLVTDWITDRFTITNLLESGGSNRLDIWTVGMFLVRENFLLGTGLGNFTTVINYYIAKMPIPLVIPPNVDPHGDWLSILGELGIIGLGFFGFMLMNLIMNLLKVIRNRVGTPNSYFISIITVWGLLIFIISIGFTSTFIYRKVYWLILALGILIPNLLKGRVNSLSVPKTTLVSDSRSKQFIRGK